MHALALASGEPSALVDWNNNYGDDPEKCVLFHCGNWPAEWFDSKPRMSTAPILETVAGAGTTYGALEGRARAGVVTFGRLTTDDLSGTVRAYVGEGEMTSDPLDTFGARGVLHVPGLEKLMQHVCRNGFEHHVAINPSRCAGAIEEAFETYLGWNVYRHNAQCERSC